MCSYLRVQLAVDGIARFLAASPICQLLGGTRYGPSRWPRVCLSACVSVCVSTTYLLMPRRSASRNQLAAYQWLAQLTRRFCRHAVALFCPYDYGAPDRLTIHARPSMSHAHAGSPPRAFFGMIGGPTRSQGPGAPKATNLRCVVGFPPHGQLLNLGSGAWSSDEAEARQRRPNRRQGVVVHSPPAPLGLPNERAPCHCRRRQASPSSQSAEAPR